MKEMVSVSKFVEDLFNAFGDAFELPIAFWYSGTPAAEVERVNGCYFKIFHDVKKGKSRTLCKDTIICPGGKFYTGFAPLPDFTPKYVSLKERYKETPECMLNYLEDFGVPKARDTYLNFARIDKLESWDGVEALIFFTTPDYISGLASWAYFDNNSEGAVLAPFGSGCSSTISVSIRENNLNGRRTFLGGFDPSVRPQLNPNELIFTIPFSRLKEMVHTLELSCLGGTPAWDRILERVNKEEA